MKKEITHTQIYAFNKLYFKVVGLYGHFDNTLGVNSYIFKVLHALVVSDLRTQKDIMQNYEMPKQTINNVILSLQKQGFIEVQTSPTDLHNRFARNAPNLYPPSRNKYTRRVCRHCHLRL